MFCLFPFFHNKKKKCVVVRGFFILVYVVPKELLEIIENKQTAE